LSVAREHDLARPSTGRDGDRLDVSTTQMLTERLAQRGWNWRRRWALGDEMNTAKSWVQAKEQNKLTCGRRVERNCQAIGETLVHILYASAFQPRATLVKKPCNAGWIKREQNSRPLYR